MLGCKILKFLGVNKNQDNPRCIPKRRNTTVSVAAWAEINKRNYLFDIFNPCIINIFSGPIPFSADEPLDRTELAIFDKFSIKIYGDNGFCIAGAIKCIVKNTGIATYFRVVSKKNSSICLDGTIGDFWSDCNIKMQNINLQAGTNLVINSFYFE